MMVRLVLLLLLACPAVASAQDVGATLQSVVRIAGTRNGAAIGGSGFVVARRGGVATVVTASHVVQGVQDLAVFFGSSTESFEDTTVLDMETDNPNGLAVLEVRGTIPDGIAVVEIDTEERPRPGEGLFLVGYPATSRVALVKQRTFSAPRGNRLLLDLSVGEGFSGGPVVRQGKVVGMVTGEDDLLTFAVNAGVIALFLEGLDVDLSRCESGKDKETVDGIVFVRICAGKFTMGSNDEKPPHEVTLSEFWIGETEVTNAQYRALHPDHSGEDDLPAAGVGWYNAKAFCEHYGFRLPTEAEWEYAARAGSTTRWSFGGDESRLEEYAWFSGNSDGKEQPVKTRKPNDWNLHDMHGNVWEWVEDKYESYSKESQKDPVVTESPSVLRVLRGGSFADEPRFLRSANRNGDGPEVRYERFGFRCVRRPRLQP